METTKETTVAFDAAKAAFLLAGFLALLLSVWLWFFVDESRGIFVGLWVPTIFSAGALVLDR